MAKANAGLKNAIKSADFRPKRLLGQPDAVSQLHLGVLVGIAKDTFFQPDPNDATVMQEGILGSFQFTSTDPDAEVMRGPRLWVPDTIANGIKDALREVDEDGEVHRKAQTVEFGFDVYAIRSSAPVGYTWLFRPQGSIVAADDPLTALATRLAKATDALALEAPKADAEAPAKTKGK